MNPLYQHILVAVDLTPDSQWVLARALPIVRHNQANLSLIHILEPLGFTYGGDIPMDAASLQDQLDEYARNRLAEIAKQAEVPVSQQHIVIGMPDTEIQRFASENAVDLIIVGSHDRTGLTLLLGSTSAGILRTAECDVLAVRVTHDNPTEA